MSFSVTGGGVNDNFPEEVTEEMKCCGAFIMATIYFKPYQVL